MACMKRRPLKVPVIAILPIAVLVVNHIAGPWFRRTEASYHGFVQADPSLR